VVDDMLQKLFNKLKNEYVILYMFDGGKTEEKKIYSFKSKWTFIHDFITDEAKRDTWENWLAIFKNGECIFKVPNDNERIANLK
jgi:hypothetical protein